jgi:putative heme iron utilization protein
MDGVAMHEPRLSRALRLMLHTQRVASLGTLSFDGAPCVSMVPFAIEPESACLIIHVSLLAPHTRNMLSDPAVSMMVMQAEVAGAPVHDLPRVSIVGSAARLQPQSAGWMLAREVYLARFPEAEPMTHLGDFSFVAIQPISARQVAGFGSARPIEAEDFASLFKPQ